MGGKFSPIIIIVLILVVLALGLFAFQLTRTKNDVDPAGTGIEDDELEKPVLSLEKSVDEESGVIKIIATATTNDPKGINCIILPDGTVVKDETAEYEVTENGKYEFEVKGVNGTKEKSMMEITEIEQASATNPYIPEGFKKLGGTVDDGFVITDDFGNQYVWVPVPSGKLKRNTQLDTDYSESDTVISELVNSVAKYYGFYMGRFEASQQEYNNTTVAASMEGKIPWTNITQTDAFAYSQESSKTYEYPNDIHTSLISSYAWDTTLAWIDEKTPGYSTSPDYGNYTGTIQPTGTTEKDRGEAVREICDLAGNVREWTTETIKDNSNTSNKSKAEKVILKVIRGGGGNISGKPSGHIWFAENLTGQSWGFRMVLYKS